MTDVVRYRLPFGMIGRAVHALKVRRDVEQIFDYRFQRKPVVWNTNGILAASGQAQQPAGNRHWLTKRKWRILSSGRT
jgi:hypothetical protein